MKIIYTNIVWFVALIIGITIANIGRFKSAEWDEMNDLRFNYTLLYGGIALILATSVFGLIYRRAWGYKLALTSNTTMALLPLSMFAASFFLMPELPFAELVSIHKQNLVVGIISLVFWLAISISEVKKEYVPQNT